MGMASLCMLLVTLGGPRSDVSSLVDRLGSPRYADREAAASALEKLGADALPALREALDSRDPEIRTRASALLDKIDSELMTRPTLIKLDFDETTLDEVVRNINAQQSAITVTLEPENPAMWKSRKLTLHESEPLPFWKAMDKVCQAGEVQHNPAAPMGPQGRPNVFALYPGRSPLPPTSDSGPFRVLLGSLHVHRDLSLVPGMQNGFAMPGIVDVPPMPRPAPPIPQPGQLAAVPTARNLTVQFYAQLQVLAEPRLTLMQSHDLKIQEAVDDRGQSLLAPGHGRQTMFFSGFSGFGAGGFIQLPVHLHLPDQPGKAIKKLRGVLPVTVSARKPDPLVIPLDKDSIGKTYRSSDVSITLHQVASDANNQRSTIDISVRPLGNPAPEPGPNLGRPDFVGFRVSNLAPNQVEVLDAQGKILQSMPTPTRLQPDEMRISVILMSPPGAAVPTQMRYYSLSRATTAVPFEFSDIPMP